MRMPLSLMIADQAASPRSASSRSSLSCWRSGETREVAALAPAPEMAASASAPGVGG